MDTATKSKASLNLGIILIIIGLLANQWILGKFLTDDGVINSGLQLNIIYGLQIILILTGLFFALKRPKLPSKGELILISISILIPLLIIEFAARFWLQNMATPAQYARFALYSELKPEEVRWHGHHYLNYYPAPNYRLGNHYHNSLGYRNEEFSKEKPDGVYRIVALGGSSTYTVAVRDNQETFTYQLEKQLSEKYGINHVQVINAGASGYDSWESLINLQFRVLDLDPDMVIIYHGVNDVHARFVVPEVYHGDNSGLRKQWTPPKIYFFEHSTVLRMIARNLGISTQVGVESFANRDTYLGAFTPSQHLADQYDMMDLLQQNPPTYYRRNLTNMVAIAKANNVDIVLSTWAYSTQKNDYANSEHYKKGFEENNAVVKEVAQQTGAYLYDFRSIMPEDPQYWSDGRHTNETGAAHKAELYADYLYSLNVLQPQADEAPTAE